MSNKQKPVSVAAIILLILLLINVLILKVGYTNNGNGYWALIFTLPLFLLAIKNATQKKTCVA